MKQFTELSINLFVQAHELHPLNKAIVNQIELCKQEIINQKAQEKNLFKKMLNK